MPPYDRPSLSTASASAQSRLAEGFATKASRGREMFFPRERTGFVAKDVPSFVAKLARPARAR
jgi:hypothetical protein